MTVHVLLGGVVILGGGIAMYAPRVLDRLSIVMAAGRRQVGGEARTSEVGFRFLLRRRLPLPPRAQRPRSPLRVHGRYCP